MAGGSGSGGSGSGLPRRDPPWKHCSSVKENKNGTICNYCRLLMKSGGIIWFKFHLTHVDHYNNTKKCHKVSFEVKEKTWEMLHQKIKAQANKTTNIKEISAHLCGTMGSNYTHVINEDDERDACWAIVYASKTIKMIDNNMKRFWEVSIGSRHVLMIFITFGWLHKY